MRFPTKTVLVLVVLGGAGAASYPPAAAYWKERNRTLYREEEVVRGRIVFEVNSTGKVEPVLSVQIGSFVSGPIEELFVDFNQEVRKGDLLARIDPRIYKSNVSRDEAMLATRRAEVERAKSQLQQAINDEKRAIALRTENKDYISDTEMDQYKFNRQSLEATLTVVEASVTQAEANLENSQLNLDYTEIRSPVDGMVIDRKIDPGQTLAAQFQTPQLFIIAPDMRKEMHILASVDEADIGLIRRAKEQARPVHFTVDAYPDDLFEGKIFQIRMSSTTTQNVVTYPVVVSAPNSDLKLLPGMTASISFQIDQKEDVLKIPNAALRYYPRPEQVRPEDRTILEGVKKPPTGEEQVSEQQPSAAEKAAAARKRNRRHVWVLDGDFLKAVEVVTGISDNHHTELISEEVTEGMKLATGVKPKSSRGSVSVSVD